MRERGLKSAEKNTCIYIYNGRSREGAWIEIKEKLIHKIEHACRSREGAWIEICQPHTVNFKF